MVISWELVWAEASIPEKSINNKMINNDENDPNKIHAEMAG